MAFKRQMTNFISKFNFKYQNDDFSCGYVAVSMVTSAFGFKNKRRWLRFILGTNIYRGTYQKDILRTLRHFGFSCVVRSLISSISTAGLKRLLESYFNRGYLAIACVDFNNHWIVVRGIQGDNVFIADPDRASPKKLTLKEFEYYAKLGSLIFVKRKE